MTNQIELAERLEKFFASEVTLSEMMAELDEVTRTLYNAVSNIGGTTEALCAVDMLFNMSKLLDLIGESIED